MSGNAVLQKPCKIETGSAHVDITRPEEQVPVTAHRQVCNQHHLPLLTILDREGGCQFMAIALLFDIDSDR